MNSLLETITPERKTHYINRDGQLIHKTKKRQECEKTYLELLRHGLSPKWFMSFHWNGRKTRSREEVQKHTKHLKNVLLTSLLNLDSPRKIPSPPERPRCVFFHEKNLTTSGSTFRYIFGGHLHLEGHKNLKTFYDLRELWDSVHPHVNELSSDFHITEYSVEHHWDYNFKDAGNTSIPDGDLCLDLFNSDL